MQPAVISLVILAVCIVLFLINKLPMTLVAVGGSAAMVLFGACEFEDAFSKLGCDTVVLMASMMVVGEAVYEVGLASLVGDRVVNLARGSERVLCMVSTGLTALISSLLSNVATMAIMISIISAICAVDRSIHFKRIILPVGMGAVMGGAATLIGSTPQLTAQGILETMSTVKFGFFDFTPVGHIVIAMLVLYVGFIGYPLSKRMWKEPETPPKAVDSPYGPPKGERGRMIRTAVIFGLTVLSFAFNLLPLELTALLSAIACVLFGCISHKKAMAAIEWDLCLRLAACLGLAEAVSVSGGDELMAGFLLRFVNGDSSPWLVFASMVLFSQVLTQFMSNSTVIVIFLPIAISLCEGLGYSVMPFAVGITMGASMAVATPMANGTIAMALIANYKFSDYVKYAGPTALVSFIIIVLLVPVLYPII